MIFRIKNNEEKNSLNTKEINKERNRKINRCETLKWLLMTENEKEYLNGFQ